MVKTLRRLRTLLLLASCGIYLLSLFFPCYFTPVYVTSDNVPTSYPHYGLEALLFGWIVLLEGHLAWLANPAWLLAFPCVLGRAGCVASLTCSLVGLLLALSFLQTESIIVNEAGGEGRIMEYGIAYWFWLSSFALLLIASALPAPERLDECNVRDADPVEKYAW